MLSLPRAKIFAFMRSKFRSAAFIAAPAAISACATSMSPGNDQWAAHGYLTPGPSGDPELIGVYASKTECEEAADAWTSQQVVGNPVFAECYPVDKN